MQSEICRIETDKETTLHVKYMEPDEALEEPLEGSGA